MQLKQQINGSLAIVYDADRISQPRQELFDPEYWHTSGLVTGRAAGRGNALVLQTEFGPAVLRTYLRGGVPARFIRDRYFFTGWQRSRPFAEASILAKLFSWELPVPEVLGGLCVRHGLFYSGALLTRQIPDVMPLADLATGTGENDRVWESVGVCIRQFHDRGVYHADLNTRNILVGSQQATWLLDFDRARLLSPGHPALQKNLSRLLRSMRKTAVAQDGPSVASVDECWKRLLHGYNKTG